MPLYGPLDSIPLACRPRVMPIGVRKRGDEKPPLLVLRLHEKRWAVPYWGLVKRGVHHHEHHFVVTEAKAFLIRGNNVSALGHG